MSTDRPLQLTQSDLDVAVERGILNADSRTALEALAKELHAGDSENERFKVFSGFNDFFVVVAACIAMTAAASLGRSAIGVLGGLASALVAWIVLEVFVRKRRMPLVAVVSTVAIVYTVGLCVFAFLGDTFRGGSKSFEPWVIFVSALVAGSLAYSIWKRFAIPISIAATTACAMVAALAFPTGWLAELDTKWALAAVFAAAGAGLFLFAMWWDQSDRKRETVRADVAFWLHILAASTFVHAVFAALSSSFDDRAVLWAFIVVAAYLLLAVVSIIVDRRALMISALAYLIFAIGKALTESSRMDSGFAAVVLIVGIKLLVLSVYWQNVRALLLRFVPETIKQKVPEAA